MKTIISSIYLITALLLFSSQAYAYKASKTKNFNSNDNSNYDNRDSYKSSESDSRKTYDRDYSNDKYRKKSKAYPSSYKSRPREKSYSRDTKRNFEKYKSYSPTKRRNLQKNWSSFKRNSKWESISDDKKRAIRRKILDKRRKK